MSLVVLIAAVSGCTIKSGDDAAPLDATMSSTSTSEDAQTTGPTAVLTVSSNGTQLYSSAAADSAEDATTGNATAGNTTASSGNGTASSGNTTGAAGNTTATSGNATGGNETSNETSADVVLEPGANVTFDASDSDGTNLTFSWSIGNVTSENVTVNHTFADAGTYNVTLTVTDADNATDEVTIEIMVGGSAGSSMTGPAGDRMETFTPAPTGGYFVGAPNCAQGGAQAEATFKWMILDVDETGAPIKAVKLVVTAEHGSAGLAHRVTLSDAAGTQLGQGTDVTVEGEFPAGEYTVVYRLCGGVSSSGASETFATASYVYA